MVWFRTDYKLDPGTVTWGNKEKIEGWRQTGKADKSEKQLRYGSSNRPEEQESLAFHFHKVKDLETALIQLFIWWCTLTQATGNHHWLSFLSYLTVCSQEKTNKYQKNPVIYSSKTNNWLSLCFCWDWQHSMYDSLSRKLQFSSELLACICQTNQTHNRSHKVTGCKLLNPNVAVHTDMLGLVQSPVTRLPLTSVGSGQSAALCRARPKQ